MAELLKKTVEIRNEIDRTKTEHAEIKEEIKREEQQQLNLQKDFDEKHIVRKFIHSDVIIQRLKTFRKAIHKRK